MKQLPPKPKKPAPGKSEILDRLPPQNVEAERQVIGSILLQPKIVDQIAGIVKPSDFYSDANARLFKHLVAMSAENTTIDAVLLTDWLKKAGDLEVIGGTAYLAEVISSVVVHHHARHYAEIVLEASQRRRIIHAATALLQSAWESGTKVEDALSAAEAALSGIKTGTYNSDPVSMYDALVEVLVEIDEIVKRKRTAGLMTGLPEFDETIGGVFSSELTILAARPGQGKTSLALQLAAHMADRGRTVYFATLEMERCEIALKRLCSEAGVSNQRVRTGKIGPDEQASLSNTARYTARKNLYLHDWPEIRPFDIARAARRLNANVIFVDYLQIVTPPDSKKKRYEQVADVSKQLKIIARQLRVPVVACAQIGRRAEETKEGRPRVSHLRESGDIEQNADMILLLWKPEDGISGKRGTGDEHDRWDAELQVAKNRKGATAVLRLDWDGPRTVFSCHGYEGQEGDW